jgi:hypothetical protein
MTQTSTSITTGEPTSRREFLRIGGAAAVAVSWLAVIRPLLAQESSSPLARGMAPARLVSHDIKMTPTATGHELTMDLELAGANSVTAKAHVSMQQVETEESIVRTMFFSMNWFATQTDTVPSGSGTMTVAMNLKKGALSADGKFRKHTLSTTFTTATGKTIQFPSSEIQVNAVSDPWRVHSDTELAEAVANCNCKRP